MILGHFAVANIIFMGKMKKEMLKALTQLIKLIKVLILINGVGKEKKRTGIRILI